MQKSTSQVVFNSRILIELLFTNTSAIVALKWLAEVRKVGELEWKFKHFCYILQLKVSQKCPFPLAELANYVKH